MSATEALRANLSAVGIKYDILGQYHTRVTVGDLSWLVEDNFDGTMDVTAYEDDVTPDEATRIIMGHGTAHVLCVYNDDGAGHSECGACGRTIGAWFEYCPWCGARFTEIERTYRP